MTKKQAIKILQQKRETANDYFKDSLWLESTLMYFERFFSKESGLYEMLAVYNGSYFKIRTAERETYLSQLQKILDDAIIIARADGLYRKPQSNFFDGKKNLDIMAILGPVLLAAFIVGYTLGAYENPANIFHQMLKGKVEQGIKK